MSLIRYGTPQPRPAPPPPASHLLRPPAAAGSADATATPGTVTATCAFPAPAVLGGASVSGPQLSTNPAFTGALTTGWTGWNGTLTGSSSPPAGCPEATAAQYVNGTTAGAIEGTVWWPAQPSAPFQMSAWVYTTNPSVQIGFDWENAAGTYVGNSLTGSVAVPASTWTLVTTTQTSNANGWKGRARVGATTAGVTIWATDIFAWQPGAPRIVATAAFPTPTVIVPGVDATVTMAGAVAATSSIPAPTVVTPDTLVTPATLTVTSSFPAPAVNGNVVASPATVTAACGFITPTVGGGAGPSPATVTATATVLTPATVVSLNGPVTATCGFPAPTAVTPDARATPATLTAVCSVPVPLVLVPDTLVTPATLACAASFPTPSVTVNTAMVGVYVGGGMGPGNTGISFTAANAMWQSWTGISDPVARYYLAASVFGYQTNMQQMVAAGTKICLTVRPAYNPVSATDLANLNTLMSTLKAAGAVVDVALWHEPYYQGLTSAQFITMWNYYAPTVRNYYPTVFVPNVASLATHGEGAYYPGDALVDKVCVDIYDSQYKTGQNMSAAAAIADGASPPKPFGIWEFNGSTNPAAGQSQADVTTFFNYVQAFMAARLTAGKVNADILLFPSLEANWLGNVSTPNCGMTGGIGNWAMHPSTGNCSVAPSSSVVHAPGIGSMAMTPLVSGNMVADCALGGTGGQPVTAGVSSVNAQAWFRAGTVTRACQVNLLWYNSSGAYLSASSGTPVTDSTGGWTQVTLAGVTAPATAAYVLPQVQVAAAASDVHYVTDVSISVTSTVPSQCNVLVFGWDYRIGLWQSLFSALNGATATGANIVPATVTATAGFPSPTVVAGSAAAPAKVLATTGFPAPAVATLVTAAPATLTATALFPAPAVSTRVTAAPATVTAAAGFPAPAVSTLVTAAPAVLTAASAFPGPAVSGGAILTPAPTTASAGFPAAAATGGAILTPATVAATCGFPAPTVITLAVITPAVLAGTSTIPVPAVVTRVTATPVALTATTTYPAPAITGGAVSVPTVLAATTTVLPPAVQGGAAPTPVTLTATTGFPSPTVVTRVTAAPATLTAASTFPAPAVMGGAVITAGAVTAASAFAIPTIFAGGGMTVNATILAVTSAFPVPQVRQDQTVTPATVPATSGFPAPAVSTLVAVAPATAPATSGFPAPTVSTKVTAAPAAAAATTLFPGPAVSGGAIVAVAALAVTTSIPAPTAGSGAGAAPATVTAATSFPAQVVTGGAITSPPVLTAAATFPPPTVGGGAVTAPLVLSAATSVPAPLVVTPDARVLPAVVTADVAFPPPTLGASATPTLAFRYNTAAGGTNGVTLTASNSGGASGYNFDSLWTTAPTWSNAVTRSGTVSIACPAITTGGSGIAWNVPGNQARSIWHRSWVNLTSLATFGGWVHEQYVAAGIVARTGISTAGKIYVYPGAGGQPAGTYALSPNTWYRLETMFDWPANQVIARVYDDTGVLLDTVTSARATTAWTVAGTAYMGSLGASTVGTVTLYLDNPAVSFNGWIGDSANYSVWRPTSAEGGASGVAVTLPSSGNLSGDAFDNIAVTAGATFAFDSTLAYSGAQSYKVATTAANQQSHFYWIIPGDDANVWARAYVNFSVMPQFAMTLMAFQAAAATWYALITTTGVPQIIGTGAAGANVPGVTLTTGVWYRIEMQVIVGTGANGRGIIRVYDAAGTMLGTAQTPATGTAQALALFTAGVCNLTPITTFNLDEIAVSDQGWIGGRQDTIAGPAVLAASTSFPAPSVLCGSAATPTALTCASAVLTPQVRQDQTVTPSVVAAATSFPAPTLSNGTTVSPAVLACAASVPAPQVTISCAAVPVPALATASVLAPVVAGGAVAAPVTLTAATALPPPIVGGGADPAPVAVTATTGFPAPTIVTGTAATPAPVTAAATFPVPQVRQDQAVTPVTLVATIGFPSPTVEGGASPYTLVVVVTAGFPSPACAAGSTVLAEPLTALAEFPPTRVLAATSGGAKLGRVTAGPPVSRWSAGPPSSRWSARSPTAP